MKTYKALDVRECRVVGKADYYRPYGLASSGSVCVPQHIRVVVIAQENNSTNRILEMKKRLKKVKEGNQSLT